jgi:hypothetical protein
MTTFIVAVYKTGKAYGGPEEGGWWYYCGEHVRTVRVFKNEDSAIAFCQRMNLLLGATLNKGRHGLGSVLCDGWFAAEIHEDFAPPHYPETGLTMNEGQP